MLKIYLGTTVLNSRHTFNTLNTGTNNVIQYINDIHFGENIITYRQEPCQKKRKSNMLSLIVFGICPFLRFALYDTTNNILTEI